MLFDVVVPPGKPIKLVVWDLDDTLWSDGHRDGGEHAVRELIATLDERGILQSAISSDATPDSVSRLGVAEYFLSPQIATAAKPHAVMQIASALNIGLDGVLLINDDPRERADVARAHPAVRAIAPAAIDQLPRDPLMGRSLVGIEPRPRRLIYLEDQARSQYERSFTGSAAELAASLATRLALVPATLAELHRVKELVNRTNQLGASYRDDELAQLIGSPDHACWLVSLADRFGDCGQVGLVLVGLAPACWTLKLLVFSCRVASRGVSTMILHALLARARDAGVRCLAEIKPTARNQAMLIAYLQAGFEEIDPRDDLTVLSHALVDIPPLPATLRLQFEDPAHMAGAPLRPPEPVR
jgi:FkbH-like protein